MTTFLIFGILWAVVMAFLIDANHNAGTKGR